jgi:hypothetical protein
MTLSKRSSSQTIYHSIKVSNIDFNKSQQDTLVYIFVEHDFLKKQYTLHKQEISNLQETIDKYRLQNVEYIDKYDKLIENNNNLQYNIKILNDNLNTANNTIKRNYIIGGTAIAILVSLVLLK